VAPSLQYAVGRAANIAITCAASLETCHSVRLMRSMHAGGAKLCPDACATQVAPWLEWHAAKLARVPAGEARTAALAELEAALARRPFLAGDAMSAADVVIGCCLLAHAAPLNACLKAYAEVRASHRCPDALQVQTDAYMHAQ
jgi:glutathione S-transferase